MPSVKTIKKQLSNLQKAKSEKELFLITKSMGVKLSMKEVNELWCELHPEEAKKQEKEEKKKLGILDRMFGKKRD